MAIRSDDEAEYHGRLSVQISEVARRLGIDRTEVENYETAVNGEATGYACARLLTLAAELPDSPDRLTLQGAVTERLGLLGRDADRAAKIAYPDPFAERV